MLGESFRGAALCVVGAASGAVATYFFLKCLSTPSALQETACCCSKWTDSARRAAIVAADAASTPACPGFGSAGAGVSVGCAGCPNRNVCSSSAGVAPGLSDLSAATANARDDATAAGGDSRVLSHDAEVAEKLAGVRKVIVVLSGKGGVGKSTVTSQLGWTLSSRGYRVGICDLDLCGPSIPLMVNKVGEEVFQSAQGWQPCFVRDNFCVMSIAYLLPEKDSAVIWRGPKKTNLIRSFLANVWWGDLDFLLVDTPPGTSDEHISLVSLLKATGALVVTTPQEAALQDVRREINFCFKTSLPVLGVVENMGSSMFTVEANAAAVFLPFAFGFLDLQKMCNEMGVPYIGLVPLDPALLAACEAGFSLVERDEKSPAAVAFSSLCHFIENATSIAPPETNDEESDLED